MCNKCVIEELEETAELELHVWERNGEIADAAIIRPCAGSRAEVSREVDGSVVIELLQDGSLILDRVVRAKPSSGSRRLAYRRI